MLALAMSAAPPPAPPCAAPSRLAGPARRLVLLLLAVTSSGGCTARPALPAGGAGPAAPAAVAQADLAVASAEPGEAVAVRLAIYLRLLQPGVGSAPEIVGFLAQNPTWPNRPLLMQRLEQAIAADVDPASLTTLCATLTLTSAAALERCATLGPPDAALVAEARTAWIHGNDQPDQEAALQHDWGRWLTREDDWQRFDRLETAGNVAAAQRVEPLLPPADQPLAEARLALRRGAPSADALAARLAGTAATDPQLLLDLARWLRRVNRDDEAMALWRTRGFAAEAAASPARLVAFWAERDALARDRLRDSHDADALALADDAAQSDPATRLDAAFLGGWISLRRLHDPVAAEARFATLLQAEAVLTRSRGAYWVAQARLARGDADGAATALRQAAAYPTTFYGQLAAARLQPPTPGPATLLDPSLGFRFEIADLARLHGPGWTGDAAIRFAGLELARVAELLVAWNDPRHARAFLLRLDQLSTDATDHALGADLADRLGLPDVAVAIARSAGRRGQVLLHAGWPRPFTPPDGVSLPPGLALAIMRQESSFDAQVTSPAGARGLMQLTVGTARDTARSLARPDPSPAGLFDPDTNMALGGAYLSGLLVRYGGSVPYAVAAYNAGPHRVDRWLADNGDPARGPAADALGPQDRMVDWIESIPFAETRNYVQRVMENQVVYQAGMEARS